MNNSAIYAGGERFDRFFKALGDPHRIKILALLRERELSAGEILEAIDIVCLNCVEDTLTDNSCCENCPVRKTYNSLTKEKD